MAGVLSSVLEEVIKSFAGNAFKKQTILNALKNRGVKEIELVQSGMKKFIEEYKGEKIPVAELEAVTKKRPDKLEAQDTVKHIYGRPQGDAPYKGIRESEFKEFNRTQDGLPANVKKFLNDIPGGHINYPARAMNALKALKQNPNNILAPDEFKSGFAYGTKERENWQQHLENALKAYTPEIEKAYEGMASKQKGKYNAEVFTKDIEHGVKNHFDTPNYYSHIRYTDVAEGNRQARYVHEIQTDVHAAGDKTQLDEDSLDHLVERAQTIYGDHFDMEDFNDTAYAGIQDLLTPGNIEGELSGKQVAVSLGMDWEIDDSVLATANEIAKQVNTARESINSRHANKAKSAFKKDPNWLNSTINKTLVDAANEGKQSVKVRIAPDTNLMRAEGVQKWYEDTVAPTLQKTAKKIGGDAKLTDDGYMEVTLPEADFKLPLYSATGIAVLSATSATKAQAAELPAKIQQARDEGYSDDEVKTFLSKKKYDANVVDRSFNPTAGARDFNDVLQGLK